MGHKHAEQTTKNDTVKNDVKNDKAVPQLTGVSHLVKPVKLQY
jgi:hypothetical protein